MSRVTCPFRASLAPNDGCVKECALFMEVDEKPSCAIKVVAEMQIMKINLLKK